MLYSCILTFYFFFHKEFLCKKKGSFHNGGIGGSCQHILLTDANFCNAAGMLECRTIVSPSHQTGTLQVSGLTVKIMDIPIKIWLFWLFWVKYFFM